MISGARLRLPAALLAVASSACLAPVVDPSHFAGGGAASGGGVAGGVAGGGTAGGTSAGGGTGGAFDAGPHQPIAVAAGAFHSCALYDDGELDCWGYNSNYQLGVGMAPLMASVPLKVGGQWKAVSAGSTHTCGVQRDGSLWCWGNFNVAGLNALIPTRIGTRNDWVQVSSGVNHACAVALDGTLWCVGSNLAGALGDGTMMSRAAPVLVDAGTGWWKVEGGSGHTCALRTDAGELWCWGSNALGQLAEGNSAPHLFPARVDAGLGWRDLAVGLTYTCGLRGSTLLCWGDNQLGQLGDGLNLSRSAPAPPVGGPTEWTRVFAADTSTFGVALDGGVWCWGNGATGQLTLDDGKSKVQPERTPRLDGIEAVAVSNGHGCGLFDGGVKCWGFNAYGQLGAGFAGTKWVPSRVQGGHAWASVAAGPSHTCAIDVDAGLWCWGSDSLGQLGDQGTADQQVPVPSRPGAWASAAVGSQHTCAIDLGGALWCWGGAALGQIANGMLGQRSGEARVGGTWRAVSAGDFFTCGIDQFSEPWCWGWNAEGRLGDGTPVTRPLPTRVGYGDGGVTELSVGTHHACALGSNGRIWCWGSNTSGEIGIGIVTPDGGVTPPAPLTLSFVPASVGAFGSHSAAIDQSGKLWMWGSDGQQQLGGGPGGNLPTPFPHPLLDGGWARVSGGDRHSCGVRLDAGLWCWGANEWGQLGTGSINAIDLPAVVGADAGWLEVSGGQTHTCAIRADRSMWCWGLNTPQLGDGEAWSAAPLSVAAP